MARYYSPEGSTNRAHQIELGSNRCTVCKDVVKAQKGCPGTVRYPWYDSVPAHLKTKTQLGREGLRLAPGQKPEGAIWRSRTGEWIYLYNEAAAVAKRQATPAQLAALARAREKQNLERRTCWMCKKVLQSVWDLDKHGMCWGCLEAEEQGRLAEARDDAITWARDLLQPAWPDWCILDTETSSLDGYVVQLGVLAPDGTVLLDSLVNPLVPIEEGARAVHHITDEQVAGAPTFAQLLDQVREAVAGRLIIAYNASFDSYIIGHELGRLRQQGLTQQPSLGESGWDCAMFSYAAYVGDWSDYHGDFRWQRLPGAKHGAIEDCRAVLELIKSMAAARLSTEKGSSDGDL